MKFFQKCVANHFFSYFSKLLGIATHFYLPFSKFLAVATRVSS